MKSTTKNNTPTQVRVPRFDLENDKQQTPQTSAADLPTTKRVSTNRRLEHEEISAESPTNIKTKSAESQQTSAKTKLAINESKVTSEEVERQRALARERSASRRASLTSEEVERQRALDRERKAAGQSSLTSEEAERQRALAREKSASRRASLTSEEAGHQRAAMRERTTTWRTNLTPRQTDRQRTLAKERSMAKRAVASPREAEEQRILVRQRSAARRVATRSKKIEQHDQVSTHNKTPVQRTATRKQMNMQGKSSKDDNVEWPKAVEIDRKINCLKKFIQNMSMNSLAESVCSICNIRGYKRDSRRVSLTQIPSIELLKVHDDLCSIIPGMQQRNNAISSDKSGIIDGLYLAIAEHDRKAGSVLSVARFFMLMTISYYR